MSTSITQLVTKDLEFIITIHNKLNITPTSWYWRVPTESQDEWILRRVELSKQRKMVEGHLLNEQTYIIYKVPLDSSLCTVQIGHDSNTSEVFIEYDELYNTLEKLFTVSKS